MDDSLSRDPQLIYAATGPPPPPLADDSFSHPGDSEHDYFSRFLRGFCTAKSLKIAVDQVLLGSGFWG